MSNLDPVGFGGVTVDRRTAAMLKEAERLANLKDPTIGRYRLCQGCWSHASASAGTHGGPGAFDMYTAGYTDDQKEIIGMAMRTVGFASWKRTRIPGKWEEHWHGIAMGTEGLPSIAAGQVRSYREGRNGLIGDGPDPDPRPKHIRTWEQYKAHQAAENDDASETNKPAEAMSTADTQPDPYDIPTGKQLAEDKDSDRDGLTDAFEKLAGTNVKKADTDADGLSDGYEALKSHTDPLAKDTDGDGALDPAELSDGSDAGKPPGVAGVVGTGVFAENVRDGVKDADSDGLSDHFEKLVGTNRRSADTDSDGLTDATEASLGTDPTRSDSGQDGLSDGLEARNASDPLASFVDASGRTVTTTRWTPEAAYAREQAKEEADKAGKKDPAGSEAATDRPADTGTAVSAAAFSPAKDPFQIDSGRKLDQVAALPGAKVGDKDTDSDGLTDAFEALAGTDAKVADSDGDKMSDGDEALRTHTDPLARDTDGDGASDTDEVNSGSDAGSLPGVAGVVGTGAFAENVRGGVKDADSDGLSDRVEKLLRTNKEKADSDADGLTDATEVVLHTNPLLADTDQDGLSDSVEIRAHSDPLSAGSALGGDLGQGANDPASTPIDDPGGVPDPAFDAT